MPTGIALVISKKLATLHELQTVYGCQDLYDLLEIIMIDHYNESLLYKK